ncbi:DNA mismatch repair endonuclease MutL [Bacillus sp. PS06]|uniref:DNA mismatch repair endonuclease MutL n=1 Tax=Bacillus sp. PS06 TaxID=2764176 RepID=UPI00177BE4F4|nr:DNA mismatch repair endonuclease MutL [Bacillus sp. PS06]MBD8068218.1 DNA mismatch repair endonuclease MutL [Bacillus sp. PS06]
MGKIRKLDDHLSNKIAAGEVVERPASVVKELVENAIDANSTIIEIEVEEAGLSKIRIIDNGDGIEPDDCLTAFYRHATSKIKDENDLFRIRSLGFRGEALPSIASVSELEMKTSTGAIGTRVLIRGGEIISHESTNSRKGTEIIVSNLFFNTPARLKYMKTIHTELGNITDVVNRISMAHPHISFRLTHNGKKLLYTNGNGDVRHVIASIYGMNIAKKMIPINLESIDFTVNGFIALPEITRASRNYISIMINGRYIKNYLIGNAIQQGYHTLLPIGRYPIVMLNIEMDPLLVDVNVHPAKLEVRLSKEQELMEVITSGIKQAFKRVQLIPEVNTPVKQKIVLQSEQQQFSFQHRQNESQNLAISEGTDTLNRVVASSPTINTFKAEVSPEQESLLSAVPIINQKDIKIDEIGESEFDYEFEETEVIEFEEETQDESPVKERVPTLYPIGQMHGTYILAQNENGLYIIDQHAAQERIKYEFFREKVGEVINESQELLIPITFEYSKDESLIIDSHKEELQKVGVFLESFGHNSYIVRSHPQWFPKGDEKELIEEIIEQVLTVKKVDLKLLREEAAIMMSCKASIKANHHLRNDEIFSLLETLRTTSDPFTCPHGRPIIIHYSTYEMEKMFKRVM